MSTNFEDEKQKDQWYFEVCEKIAARSKCLSRHVAAILVRDGVIIAQGYNGPPRGAPHCNDRYKIDPVLRENMKNLGKDPDDPQYYKTCPRYVLGFKSGQGLDWCVAGHGERNALINAAMQGMSTKGARMYMNCAVPCTPCLVEIINAGVIEMIVTKIEYYDISAEYLVKNSKIKLRIYKHFCKHENTIGSYCKDCDSEIPGLIETV